MRRDDKTQQRSQTKDSWTRYQILALSQLQTYLDWTFEPRPTKRAVNITARQGYYRFTA